MPSRFCIHYLSNLEDPAVAIGQKKGQSSSQSPRRVVLKNIQTTKQLHSSPILVRLCSKSSKLGFSIMWTQNLQMFKLSLERQRYQRSNRLHLLDHRESKRIPGETKFCFIDYAKAFDCVNHNKMWETVKEMRKPDYLSCLLRNLYAGQEATDWTHYGTTDWFKIEKGIQQGCLLSPWSFHL